MEIRPIPAVSAVIFNSENQVLLTKRSDQVREPGKWCVPGGHLEGGDSWIQSVTKEVKEETGLEIEDPLLLGLYSEPAFTQSIEPFPEGFLPHYVVMTFLIRRYSGELRLNSEVTEFKWCDPKHLLQPIIRANALQIADALLYSGDVFVR